MVQDTVCELEGYKAKVQETIDHVASGVTTLNEDQVEKAKDMLDGLEDEFHEMKARALAVLDRPRPVFVPVENPVKRFQASDGHMVEDPAGPYVLYDVTTGPLTTNGTTTVNQIDGPARFGTYVEKTGPADIDVVEAEQEAEEANGEDVPAPKKRKTGSQR